MDSALTTIGLPVALAIVMFGLGLDLTPRDFGRVGREPKAVLVALACQLLLMPAIAFGLVVAFGLPGLLGVGMMLLAASPGGTNANLFSHLFRGDVALNITLTAINSLLALATLPLITNLAISYFDLGATVSLPFGEVAQVFALILVPVAIGMLVRRRRPAFATAMDRPVRLLSALILAALVVAILVEERDKVGQYFADVGLITALFCALSLVVGYAVTRAAGVTEPQAVASSFEIGVHNSTLAIFVAIEVLDRTEASVPAAVYSLFMFVFAAGWGWLLTRRRGAVDAMPQIP